MLRSFYTSSPANWANGFLQLFYPRVCAGCERELPRTERQCFCLPCRRLLEPTDLHTSVENEFTNRLWGRIPLLTGSAYYHFKKRTPIQRAIFKLKYGNKPDIGYLLGYEYGQILKQATHFQSIEYVLPVPLHPAREQQRGYNQSQMFAAGLAESMNIKVEDSNLQRGTNTQSQTKRHRYERFENVDDIFGVRRPDRLKGSHVLLVDDVFTTGATLESCARTLQDIPDIQISMATIAMASLRS
jgi:competence protein ComFC